jgi:hypothetical protein
VCRPAAVKCTGAWAKLCKTLVYQRQKNLESDVSAELGFEDFLLKAVQNQVYS